MRDPKRTETILSLLETIWSYDPNLRMGQIFINAMQLPSSPFGVESMFYVEDDKLIEGLERFLSTIQQFKQPRT